MTERTPDIPDPEEVGGDHGGVIGLYDSEGGVPTYVVADVASDDRWVSVPAAATLSLEEWQ
ncbi:DUF7556 family protein [Natronomonas marina]|jgi:hypothetical protein|uniref:DUF7556 family protein n=1 Tax=Natronomonas marina TaxID=2961939 RepID=UPI0020C97089|nr:hypothetical protein [Natronomonas marina]